MKPRYLLVSVLLVILSFALAQAGSKSVGARAPVGPPPGTVISSAAAKPAVVATTVQPALSTALAVSKQATPATVKVALPEATRQVSADPASTTMMTKADAKEPAGYSTLGGPEAELVRLIAKLISEVLAEIRCASSVPVKVMTAPGGATGATAKKAAAKEAAMQMAK